MTARTTGRGAAGPWTKVVLGITTTLAASSGLVGTLGVGTAVAQPVSRTLTYTCSFPLIGDQSVTARISADIPKGHTVGQPTHRFAMHAVATVGTVLTQGLNLVGAETVEGTLDAQTNVAAPQGDMPVTAPLTIVKTHVPGSGSLSIPANGIAPSRTFSKPGRAEITVGDFTAHLIPRDADGDLTILREFDLPCTLDDGQDNVFMSFDIDAARASPSPAASTTSPAPAAPPSPSGEGTASATAGAAIGRTTTPNPSGTTSASASGTATAKPSITTTASIPSGSTIDETRSDSTDGTRPNGRKKSLLYLTAGTLVVGTTALLFSSRLRKPRDPNDVRSR